MIATIRRLLETAPFEPFTIQTSNGREYVVPTADHASVNPKGTRVVVFLDEDDSQITLTVLRIVGVLEKAQY